MDMSEEEFSGIDAFVLQKSLVEPVITAQNLYSIYQCPDQQMYRARIQFLFNLDQFAFDPPTLEALIDMMHGAILFASDNDFSYPKAIVFLSIYLTIFQLATMSPFYLPKELYRRYEKILLAHSIDRPPFATMIFELSDIKLIHEFFTNTFFRNVKLIINCFTQKQLMSFKSTFPVCVPIPDIVPLAEMEMIVVPNPDEENSENQNAAEQQNVLSKNEAQQSSKMLNSKSPRSPHIQTSSEKQATSSILKSREIASKDSNKQLENLEPVQQPDQPEDRGPDVPIELLRGSLAMMHEKFITDFEEKERLIIGKIKELEIKIQEKPQMKKPQTKKK